MDYRKVVQMFRTEVDDLPDPAVGAQNADEDLLWKDHEIEDYFLEAQTQLAEDAYLLIETKKIPITEGEALVEKPATFYKGRSARLVGGRNPVAFRNMNELDDMIADDYGLRSGMSSDWLALTGRVSIAIQDHTTGYLRLYRIPEEDDELEINFYARPDPRACRLVLTSRDHVRAILSYMKMLAYAKQDVDALDLRRSESFGLDYERRMADIAGKARREHRRPGTTRYGGL